MASMNEQAFLKLLAEMQNSSRTLVTTSAPLDDKHLIYVNLDTREIELKNTVYSQFLSVNEEHYAETVYFKVPRYFDGVDLFQMAIVVEYVNAKGESHIAPIGVKDISSYPGYIVFGWCIHGNATIATGTIQFAIHFYTMDFATGTLAYSLRTRPVSSKIMYGINAADAKIEANISTDYDIDDILAAIARSSIVYWTNL